MKRKILVSITKSKEIEVDIPDYKFGSQGDLQEHVNDLIRDEFGTDWDDWDWIGAEPFLIGEEPEPQDCHWIKALGRKWVTDGCAVFRPDVQPIKQKSWRKASENVAEVIKGMLVTDLNEMPIHTGYFASMYRELLSNPEYKVLGEQETATAFVLKEDKLVAIVMPVAIRAIRGASLGDVAIFKLEK
jgi:hypothetical protein